MQAILQGLYQSYEFESGAVSNTLVLRLPSGEEVRALVDDGAALAITRAYVASLDAPATRDERGAWPSVAENEPDDARFEASLGAPMPEEGQFTPAMMEDDARVFGGQISPRCGADVEPVPSAPSEEAAASQPRPTRPRAPIVQKDEYGYPVFRGRGYAEPRTLVGGHGDGEEDGVGSI